MKDDQFSQQVTILGWGSYETPYGGIARDWRLRSWVDKQTRAVSHQIYIEMSYDDEYQFFEAATDDTARSLAVIVIDRSFMCPHLDCTHFETIGVEIDEATLRARADQGFRIKVSSRRGSTLILPLSPTQIGLQLAAIDRLIPRSIQVEPSPSPSSG